MVVGYRRLCRSRHAYLCSFSHVWSYFYHSFAHVSISQEVFLEYNTLGGKIASYFMTGSMLFCIAHCHAPVVKHCSKVVVQFSITIWEQSQDPSF